MSDHCTQGNFDCWYPRLVSWLDGSYLHLADLRGLCNKIAIVRNVLSGWQQYCTVPKRVFCASSETSTGVR